MKKMWLKILIMLVASMVGIHGTVTSALAKDKVTVLLDWFVNPDHAPFFVALEKGYFSDHGLEVTHVISDGLFVGFHHRELDSVDLDELVESKAERQSH